MKELLMAELSETRLDEIIEGAINRAIENFDIKHPCRFDASEIAMVKSQYESMVEENANHGTFRIMIQMGKSWQDITGGFRRAGLMVLAAITLIGFVVTFIIREFHK